MTDLYKLKEMGKDFSVLLVDDEVSSVNALGHILERIFARVDIALNVEDAIKCYDENRGFDIIITDMWMPPVDGFEFSKIVKKAHPGQKVIMVSGSRNERDLKKIESEGIDAFVSKPIDRDRIYQTLYTIVSAIKNERGKRGEY